MNTIFVIDLSASPGHSCHTKLYKYLSVGVTAVCFVSALLSGAARVESAIAGASVVVYGTRAAGTVAAAAGPVTVGAVDIGSVGSTVTGDIPCGCDVRASRMMSE